MTDTIWDHETLRLLRLELATLYPDERSIRRVVDEASLPAQYVSFDTRAANTWHSVLHEAKIRGLLNTLLEYVFMESVENAITIERIFSRSAKGRPPVPTDAAKHEDITGERSALVPVRFLQKGLDAARRVGLVILRDGALGTGFLLRHDIFVTCNHVIATKEQAQTATFRFNYEESLAGATAQFWDYKADPDQCFITSPELTGHDYTIVKLLGEPSHRWGYLPITERRATIGERVNIVQHPGGELKQLSYFHNIVVHVNEVRVEYKTDTRDGSSGAPVFDKDWHVVAVHTGSRSTKEIPRSEQLKRNFGTHIDIISRALARNGIVGMGYEG